MLLEDLITNWQTRADIIQYVETIIGDDLMARAFRAIFVLGNFLLLFPQALGLPVAHAQDQPLIWPTRDAVVVYTMTVTGKSEERFQVIYGGTTRRVRLDFLGDATHHQGSIIVDEQEHKRITLLTDRNAYIEDPIGDSQAGLTFLLDDRMKFARIGESDIAGQKCIDWQVSGSDNAGTACVTIDGVLLRATRGQPTASLLMATFVEYRAETDQIFRPPPSYTKLVPSPRNP